MTRKYPNTRPKRIATLPCENVCAQKSGKTVKQTAMLSISVFVFFVFFITPFFWFRAAD